MSKKKLVLAWTLVFATVIIFGVLAFFWREQPEIIYTNYKGDYGEYEPLDLVMNAGDTYTVTTSHFQGLFPGLDIEIEKFEFTENSRIDTRVFNPDAVTLSGNVITAEHNGFVNVYANLYEKVKIGAERKRVWHILVAQIQVINIEEMTEITTAHELQDISLDLDGNYILKADIDLEGFDWSPIMLTGTGPTTEYAISFKGSLINPDGFTIKNLTGASGLFAYIYGAYIDGIILENVNIDSSGSYPDDDGNEYTVRGGIAGYATDTIIINCKVDGAIKASSCAGGIVGSVRYGVIRNCEFNGTVVAEYKGEVNYLAYAGGVAGIADILTHNYPSEDIMSGLSARTYLTVGIIDCKVNAEIIAIDYAGGIVGFNYGDSVPTDCIFLGVTQGAEYQGEICGYSWF